MYNHKNGITLRKVEKSDLGRLLRLKQESWWGTHTTPALNMQDQERWFSNMPSNMLCLVGDLDVGDLYDAHVGVAIISDIDPVNRFARLSGSIYESQRKDNLVKDISAAVIDYCFEMLNLNRIDAEVLESNYAAQKYWTQHLLFVVEGKRRQAVYKCGQYYDSLVLGMLREDWLKHPRVVAYNGSCNKNVDHDLAKKFVERSRAYLQSTSGSEKV